MSVNSKMSIQLQECHCNLAKVNWWVNKTPRTVGEVNICKGGSHRTESPFENEILLLFSIDESASKPMDLNRTLIGRGASRASSSWKTRIKSEWVEPLSVLFIYIAYMRAAGGMDYLNRTDAS